MHVCIYVYLGTLRFFIGALMESFLAALLQEKFPQFKGNNSPPAGRVFLVRVL